MYDFDRYKETGTVVFFDRRLFPRDRTTQKLFLSMVETPSEYAMKNGRIMRNLSVHESDSGVVLIDKRRNLQ